MKEEERRMEEAMERERVLAAKEFEKAAETERLKKKLQAIEVNKQIKENEIIREMELAKMAQVCARYKTSKFLNSLIHIQQIRLAFFFL